MAPNGYHGSLNLFCSYIYIYIYIYMYIYIYLYTYGLAVQHNLPHKNMARQHHRLEYVSFRCVVVYIFFRFGVSEFVYVCVLALFASKVATYDGVRRGR